MAISQGESCSSPSKMNVEPNKEFIAEHWSTTHIHIHIYHIYIYTHTLSTVVAVHIGHWTVHLHSYHSIPHPHEPLCAAMRYPRKEATYFSILANAGQIILSDGSAESKIRAPFTAVKGESFKPALDTAAACFSYVAPVQLRSLSAPRESWFIQVTSCFAPG